MMFWVLIAKRILRRIKYIFIFKEIISWKYESCERCGHCFRLVWSVKDPLWKAVYGSSNGCLCFDCFVELAMRQNIELTKDDIVKLEVFLPKD
jgi:hypothetical protein